MAADLSSLTEQLLDAARQAGADAADALAVDGVSISIDVLKGKLEHAERAESVDLGLRVLVGAQHSCVSASDIKRESIEEMATRAVAMAREAPADPTIGLADPAQLAAAWDVAALDLADPSDDPPPGELQDRAARAEAAALAVDGISKIDSASAAFGRRRLHLAATNGFSGGYARTDHAISCVAITGSGTTME